MQNQLLSRDEASDMVGASLLRAAGISTVADERSDAEEAVRGPRQQLPLVGLFDTGTDQTRYWTVTTVSDRGRFADGTPLKVLGWAAGTSVTIATIPASGVIVVRRGGTGAVTPQGHLRLPADVRQGCRIRGGDRVLVVAHPTEDLLIAYMPYAIDAMAGAYHTSIPGHA
jgi:hypothetical protein